MKLEKEWKYREAEVIQNRSERGSTASVPLIRWQKGRFSAFIDSHFSWRYLGILTVLLPVANALKSKGD